MNTLKLSNGVFHDHTFKIKIKKPIFFGLIFGTLIVLAIIMMAAATPYKCVTINTGSGIYCKEYKCTAATCPPGTWTLVKTVPGTCPAQCPF